MQLRLILFTLALVTPSVGAFAEETIAPTVLPQACRAAMMSVDKAMSGSATATGDAAGAAHSMEGMEAPKPGDVATTGGAQEEAVEAANGMHGPMMAAAKIVDPDLAFNCGMLVHHQGAIDMARIELKYGKDPKSRQMAEKIIEAQTQEITEMSAHIEAMTKQ